MGIFAESADYKENNAASRRQMIDLLATLSVRPIEQHEHARPPAMASDHFTKPQRSCKVQ